MIHPNTYQSHNSLSKYISCQFPHFKFKTIFSLANQFQYQINTMPSETGFIEVIYGPMFSGKSSEMLRKVRRYRHAKKQCLVINYINDNRYFEDACMSTHDKMTEKAIKTSCLDDIIEQARKYEVIAIDEGQFFPQIVEFSEKLANQGKIIIIAALDGTFQRKAFGNIINLLPVAEKVIKLSAVCVYCTKEAAFTLRTIDSQEIELIGGEESYKPVCRKCYFAQQQSTNKVECARQKEVMSYAPESTPESTPTKFNPEISEPRKHAL